MPTFRIAVIGGDGIGPEVIEPAVRVAERAAKKDGATLEFWPAGSGFLAASSEIAGHGSEIQGDAQQNRSPRSQNQGPRSEIRSESLEIRSDAPEMWGDGLENRGLHLSIQGWSVLPPRMWALKNKKARQLQPPRHNHNRIQSIWQRRQLLFW